MNIWKLTSTNEVRTLTAVVIALTPREASSLFIHHCAILISEKMTCKQLGVAASDLQIPEIICISKTINKQKE